MLQYLHLKNVGPAPEMQMELAPRLNVITGDNGFGKSFLLDIAWWALTRTWASYPARPRPGARGTTRGYFSSGYFSGSARPPSGARSTPSISFAFEGKVKRNEYESVFDRQRQTWKGRAGRPANPGLVLYAQVDGGFAVWDPARNYWRTVGKSDEQDRPPAYIFQPSEVWDGLMGQDTPLCNGLIRDWASWQKEQGRPFQLLRAALEIMSPSSEEPLTPGNLTRISLDDVRDMPTLRLPYSPDTPIVHASAGMRRIAALVYLLVWAWEEHQRASELLEKQPTRQVIFLIDELDTHLHPRWQRLVLRSLLEVVAELMTGGQSQVQLVTATHSPLVLASLEPLFDEDQDALWHLGLAGQAVTLDRVTWAKQGDVVSWLVSDIFGLAQARSREAEQAIEAAEALMRGELAALPKDLRNQNAIDKRLRELLPGHDPFWPRWLVETGKVGSKPRGRRKRS